MATELFSSSTRNASRVALQHKHTPAMLHWNHYWTNMFTIAGKTIHVVFASSLFRPTFTYPAYIFNKQGALLFLIVISLMIYFLNNRTAKLLDTGCNWINTDEMGRFRGISEQGEHVDVLKHLALPPFTLCNQLFCSLQHNRGYSFKRKTTLPHTTFTFL